MSENEDISVDGITEANSIPSMPTIGFYASDAEASWFKDLNNKLNDVGAFEQNPTVPVMETELATLIQLRDEFIKHFESTLRSSKIQNAITSRLVLEEKRGMFFEYVEFIQNKIEKLNSKIFLYNLNTKFCM